MLRNKTLWWTLLVTWILGSAYWHVCKINRLCDLPLVTFERDDVSYPVVPAEVTPPLIIFDAPNLQLQAAGNFIFEKSNAVGSFEAVTPAIDSLAQYLIANMPGKHLIITGSFSSTEINMSDFADLGIARAAGVKKQIVHAGVPDSLITLKSDLNDGISFPSDSLHGGINFTFENKSIHPATENDFAQSEKFENIFKPMDLYFPTASIIYIKTKENQRFMNEAKAYLLTNLDKFLLLTGHTDNEDSAAWNHKLSRKRAIAVKGQLVKVGFPPKRMFIDGKGESQPKASNDTPQGRIANRRVTIVVK
jgi:OOP family OmpA-OmpF porin